MATKTSSNPESESIKNRLKEQLLEFTHEEFDALAKQVSEIVRRVEYRELKRHMGQQLLDELKDQ